MVNRNSVSEGMPTGVPKKNRLGGSPTLRIFGSAGASLSEKNLHLGGHAYWRAEKNRFGLTGVSPSKSQVNE